MALPTTVQPLLWILSVMLFYVSVGAGIVLLLLALYVRRLSLILGAAGLSMLLVVAYLLLASKGVLGGLTAGLLSLLLELAFYGLSLRRALDWQAIKFGKETLRQTSLHLVLISGSILFLIPFAWLVVTSLKEDKEMSKFPPEWIPTQQDTLRRDGQERMLSYASYEGTKVKVATLAEKETGESTVRIVEPLNFAGVEFVCDKTALTEIRHFAPVWKNYADALKFLPPEAKLGLVFVGNTALVTTLSILGTLLACSMVAYSFSRLRWPGRDTLFVVLLATMMLPSAVTMMPQFLIYRSLGWIDTLYPLWVPTFFGSAYRIFLLRQFFLGIPNELEDAAKIDGCSYRGIFWRIMLPQIKPALAALTIMAFMEAWNDFRGPLIYISSPEHQTLAYALQLFQTSHGGEPGLLMAASTMVMLPVLLLFFFTQRYFIEGITLTGIKG